MNWNIFNDSIMRIGKNISDWEDLGTCFHAPIYSLSNPSSQYVVTAYHVIAEAYCSRQELFVIDTTSNIPIRANVVVVPPRNKWLEGYDYAILQLTENISGRPLTCAKNPQQPVPVVIRGRPDGLETQFTSIHGFFYGIENRKVGNCRVLEIRSEDFPVLAVNSNEEGIYPHKIWRGISGAPIVMYDSSNYNTSLYVLGFIIRIADNGRAGRAYGVPISLIEEVCNTNNLLIDLDNLSTNSSEVVTSEDFLIDLCGGLEDPLRENLCWNVLSNLLYRGRKVEELIIKALNSSAKLQLDLCDIVFLEYFLGRFLFKRGKNKLAEERIFRSLRYGEELSSKVKARIRALAKARLVIEDGTTNIEEKIKEFIKVNHAIQDLEDVSDQYISSESASLLGRHLTSLFIKPGCFTRCQEQQVDKLIIQHNNLIQSNPVYLAKQDVVNTSLQCLSLLWKADKINNVDSNIFNLNELGFQQSKRCKNSIFYAQMLYVKAIVLWGQREGKKALSIFVFLGKISSIYSIKFTHEGVFQLFAYLQSNMPQCTHILELSLNMAQERNVSLSEVANIYTIANLRLEDAIAIECKSKSWLDEMSSYGSLYEMPHTAFD